MAVQQNKKSPSKRGMHRSHDFLSTPPLAIEPTTGEVRVHGAVVAGGSPRTAIRRARGFIRRSFKRNERYGV